MQYRVLFHMSTNWPKKEMQKLPLSIPNLNYEFHIMKNGIHPDLTRTWGPRNQARQSIRISKATITLCWLLPCFVSMPSPPI